ncbi:hypothetical protein LEP1GSC016_1954 [Leptospira borgpetersenii serovar Hardjo-bovis str. Sponselee]|uniref:Uncharacterized protein n=1 Tax=Leptospira borgpetersenii serovar Hardjo-bovis str. Sponselee TaxID=1303729 RepID=M6BX45_LEPBO|nr:hypothetical protein LEP1GSC016_1954 [Leptospira borgpetersenii serovar Hardjo-bovis str. Sponselee]
MILNKEDIILYRKQYAAGVPIIEKNKSVSQNHSILSESSRITAIVPTF